MNKWARLCCKFKHWSGFCRSPFWPSFPSPASPCFYYHSYKIGYKSISSGGAYLPGWRDLALSCWDSCLSVSLPLESLRRNEMMAHNHSSHLDPSRSYSFSLYPSTFFPDSFSLTLFLNRKFRPWKFHLHVSGVLAFWALPVWHRAVPHWADLLLVGWDTHWSLVLWKVSESLWGA